MRDSVTEFRELERKSESAPGASKVDQKVTHGPDGCTSIDVLVRGPKSSSDTCSSVPRSVKRGSEENTAQNPIMRRAGEGAKLDRAERKI